MNLYVIRRPSAWASLAELEVAGAKSARIVDVAKPEAVMYEPSADGKLTLIAVEYITLKGPASLEGHLFNFTNSPNRYGLPPFYELHVWAWKANDMGTFADMNPHVSCDASKAESK